MTTACSRAPTGSRRVFTLLALALSFGLALARAQAPLQPAAPAVAAASVRWLCNAACRRFPQGFASDPMHYACDVCNLAGLLSQAYGQSSHFRYAPAWWGEDYYQVHITATVPLASKTQMEQSLLRDVLLRCFSLQIHETTKRVPGFALQVAPGGLKFRRVEKAVPGMAAGVVHFDTISRLVTWLNWFYYNGKMYGMTGPVYDATGLSGTFDIPVPFPQPGTGVNLLAEIGRLGIKALRAPSPATTLDIVHLDHLRTSCFIPH